MLFEQHEEFDLMRNCSLVRHTAISRRATIFLTAILLINQSKEKFVTIQPILKKGLFITNLVAKPNIFNNYFVEQCSFIERNSTLPTFSPWCLTVFQSVHIDRENVLNSIRSVDANKPHVMIL